MPTIQTKRGRAMHFEADYKNPEIVFTLKNLDETELARLLNVKISDEKIYLDDKKPSKWAKLVEENQKDPIDLGDYTEQDRKDRAEFKENFAFKHDL